MIDPSSLAAGVMAGVVSDRVTERLHADDEKPHLIEHGECLHNDIHHVKSMLEMIFAYCQDYTAKHIDKVIMLRSTPNTQTLTTKNRKHNLIMVSVSTSVIITVPGISSITYTLQPGWNQLDLPDDSQIALASGSDTSVLYRCTNTLMV